MKHTVPHLRRAVAATLLTALPLAAAPVLAGPATPPGSAADLLADIQVKGRVTDDKGNGLPGVTVVVKGTTNGTQTDADGRFTLTAADNATLLLSFVGYATQELPVSGRTEFNVQLAPDTKALDEVVVTGYQVQRKADLTGAVAVVKVDEVKDLPSGNVMRNLQGRVPGVSINTDGAPDGAVSVRIRGLGTLGNNDPLYVIDGIPTKDGINQLNQNDIESIQVLKDASAASIYGSRAGNGVIIITTKKAKKGYNRVEFSTFATVQKPRRITSMLNTQEYGRVYWQAAVNSGNLTPTSPLYTYRQHTENGQPVLDEVIVPEFIDADKTQRAADTDWFDEIQQTSLIQSYNLSLANGGERGNALFSLNYYDNDGVVRYSNYKRMTARMNSDYSFFDGKLKIGENLLLSRNRTRFGADRDAINYATVLPTIVPVRTADGAGWGGPVNGISDRQNPVRLLEDNKQNFGVTSRAFGNVFADLEVIKGLHLRSSFGIDYSLFDQKSLQKKYKSGYLSDNVNRLLVVNRNFGNWVWQNTLNYHLGAGKNQVDFLLGAERISYNFNEVTANRSGFASEDINYAVLDAGSGAQLNTGFSSAYRLASYFGKVNYSFDERYLASVTVRRDGSSRFGKENQFGWFPAASVGWRLSEEGFIKNHAALISDLKLRAGWGQTGNQDIANDAAYSLYRPLYGSDPTWDPDPGTAYDIAGIKTGALPSGYRRFQQGNDQLKWETTTQSNFGVDFGLLQNKLTGSVDYFVKNTRDILVLPPYIAAVGEGGSRWVNGASIENKGWEVLLSYQDELPSTGFAYNVTANLSRYRNEVTKLPREVINAYGGNGQDVTIIGQAFGSRYGYVADGLFQSQSEVDTHATQVGAAPGRIRYQDLNGDGKIDNFDQTWITNNTPDFIYGLTVGGSWKGLDLQLFWQGVQGLKVFNDTKFRTDFTFANQENWGTRVLDAWSPTNTGSTIPAVSLLNQNNEWRPSTYFVENGSYLKLRNVQLGYSFPKALTSTLRLQQLRLYVQGTNLVTFKDRKGPNAYTSPDPEVQLLGFPIAPAFSTGLNVTF
ncbi:SusC/RagA family TonB-linked outer membrane protein [Hymenobacter edaphi]|uniref:SusC/RagA family protein n=1 Tax=Hymenobacter edaphi TaxID=2211146 RepID=A0A328BK27_9BACT|nr:TonB-dependent receptor [Hymenobacter edaphi]RAK67015.1 SusC/RagA family protein [Hymenobacter edaphi]